MALSVAEIMARAGLGSGDVIACTTLTGGLSHRVLRVETDGGTYVVRVLDPAVSEAGLGVPARLEIENTVRAAGVGPAVLYADGDTMVLEYIEGATLDRDDVRRLETIPRLAAACRRLHAGPAFAGDFNIFRKAEELLDRCRRHDLRVPDGYGDHLPVMTAIEGAVERAPLPAAPCHNDLLPENFIDDGHDVRIVDFQLSGMNDPAFELGDIAAEGDFEPGRVEALAAAYFGGEMSAALLARVRLYLLVSNVTWTLWFAIHHGLLAHRAADAAFDYDAEAADKWGQARRDLADPDLGRLIDLTAHRGRAVT
ncbi:choline/ethanolamine kinase family protein [Actinomadura sp. DC4]|uniref:choline/ethanolamine kinase family protein n=1 Tax=Actinomadura sp. DC4 TaxID=3055069 RepID=UPI0025AF9BA0|nr:choline/ethanolamine kinase family protein [Actinomadura sp. DC4]MDN3351643.1 choline/ethanolamine kinase family protein [Actinomadura sp. DC4]